MKYYLEEGVPSDFVEFLEKLEGVENRVENYEDADVLICSEKCKNFTDKIIVLFGEEQVKVVRNDKELAMFPLQTNYHAPLWVTLKIYTEGKSSIVTRRWARKVVSGILQGMIALMEVEDKEGYSHSQRVALLSVQFGKYLGLDDEDIEKLREHAMLHDVGKIGIEQLMLYSPTRIRTFESIPQDHTVLGSIYLSTIEFLWDVIPTVRHHHERWDGKGYPDGLKGEEIPYFARIVAICNHYDNLTNFVTSEWLGGPKTKDEALKIIEEEAGRMFDPVLAKKFVDMMRSEPELGQSKKS